MGRSSDTSCLICGCYCGEGRQICYSCEQDINAGKMRIRRNDEQVQIVTLSARLEHCLTAGDCEGCDMNKKQGCSFDSLLNDTLAVLKLLK